MIIKEEKTKCKFRKLLHSVIQLLGYSKNTPTAAVTKLRFIGTYSYQLFAITAAYFILEMMLGTHLSMANTSHFL